MLLKHPNLSERVAVTVGNAIFAPAIDEDRDYVSATIDIDGHPYILISTQTSKPQNISDIIPAESFDYEGISFLFRKSGIPIEFKEAVFKLASYRKDPELLSIAFKEEEYVKLEREK